jgi:hypothetical protein
LNVICNLRTLLKEVVQKWGLSELESNLVVGNRYRVVVEGTAGEGQVEEVAAAWARVEVLDDQGHRLGRKL